MIQRDPANPRIAPPHRKRPAGTEAVGRSRSRSAGAKAALSRRPTSSIRRHACRARSGLCTSSPVLPRFLSNKTEELTRRGQANNDQHHLERGERYGVLEGGRLVRRLRRGDRTARIAYRHAAPSTATPIPRSPAIVCARRPKASVEARRWKSVRRRKTGHALAVMGGSPGLVCDGPLPAAPTLGFSSGDVLTLLHI